MASLSTEGTSGCWAEGKKEATGQSLSHASTPDPGDLEQTHVGLLQRRKKDQ